MPTRKLNGLYAITDESLIPSETFSQTVELALSGGAKIIQYRDKSSDSQKQEKQAAQLRVLCNQHNALLIINDDIELAKKSKADGVHLGENDADMKQARTFLGEDFIIGVSCYNILERAIAAEKNGASYVAFGAAFPSSTKPDARVIDTDLLYEAKKQLSIPVCAIGGINSDNAASIYHTADMLAVINGLFGQKNITEAALHFSRLYK